MRPRPRMLKRADAIGFDELREHIGEMMHTALRKGCDGGGAHEAWIAISSMDRQQWGNACNWIISALRETLGRPEPAPPSPREPRTQCKHGHPWPENLAVRPSGQKDCKLCVQAYAKKRYWENPEGERLRSKVKYYGSLEAVPPSQKARRDAARDMKLDQLKGAKHG